MSNNPSTITIKRNGRFIGRFCIALVLLLAGGLVAKLPFTHTVVTAAASFLTSVAHNATLAGDGTTASPLGIANNGVGTSQIANDAVTAPKVAAGQVVKSINGLSDGITLAAGSNVSLTLTGQTLTISSLLGLTSVAHDSTLQGDGTAGSPLGIANFGVGSNQLANSTITAQKIAPGQLVTSINNLRDNVTLTAGSNITITPSGNTLTIGASASSSQPLINPLRVATLRWYEGNDTGAGLSFGQPAVALAFDGAHMWATVGNSLIKFRPSDCAILESFSTQAGGTAGPLTFDGANIWVGISDNPLLLKFRASDGALIGTFSLSGIAQELAFDGFHIWATIGTKLVKHRPSDGVAVELVDFGTPLQGLAIAESWVWVTLSNGTVMRAFRFGFDDGILGPYNVGINPKGIAFDGVNLWIANSGNKFVTKLRGSDGAFLGNFNIPVNIGDPTRIAFDGANMWVTTSGGRVERFPVSTGVSGRSFSAGTNPGGIAFDGANIWVAHSSGVNKL